MKKLYRWWPSVRGDSARPNSPNIHGIRLHYVTGISHLQIGIEMIWMSMWNRKYSPSHLANAPVWFGLVPMPCYALRHASLCLKEACRPSQSHKDRVKKTAATATGNATGNNGCHLCQVSFTQFTQATTLIILTQRTFSYGQREKIDQGGTWEIFWAEKQCKLQVASRCKNHMNRFFSLPFGWCFYHVSLHREHRNLELPGPSLRRNRGKCMSVMNV